MLDVSPLLGSSGGVAVLDAPPRTTSQIVADVLASLNITPITPESAEVYRDRVVRDGAYSYEEGPNTGLTPAWQLLNLSAVPDGAPIVNGVSAVPERIREPLANVQRKLTEEGVRTTPVAWIFEKDPLVGFKYEDSGMWIEVLVGGYKLDQRHARVLVGGIRA